jgi:hypothetical protein
MAPRALAVLLVLLFVAFPVASATPSAVDTGYAAQTTPTANSTETPVVENTTLSIQLQASGDAQWRLVDTYALEDGNDSRAFEQLADEFTSNDTALGWEQSFRDASTRASNATGREMQITNVSRSATTGDREGRLVLEFTWTNFATANGGRLVVQDAFNTTGGTWLPRLYDNQTLAISPPAGYAVSSAPPTEIDDGAVRFRGPQTFEPGYIDIVYSGDQPDETPTTTSATPGSGPATGGDLPWLGAGLVLVAALAVAAVYIGRQDDRPPAGASGGGPDDGGDPDGALQASQASETDDDLDVELLSDEERVERLLTENGGRMKQARIVTETGWSNAKVSQLLSSMDEEGRIDKLRIGRENLISFPDEDVTEIED